MRWARLLRKAQCSTVIEFLLWNMQTLGRVWGTGVLLLGLWLWLTLGSISSPHLRRNRLYRYSKQVNSPFSNFINCEGYCAHLDPFRDLFKWPSFLDAALLWMLLQSKHSISLLTALQVKAWPRFPMRNLPGYLTALQWSSHPGNPSSFSGESSLGAGHFPDTSQKLLTYWKIRSTARGKLGTAKV